jgi:hypothetical protein
LRLDSDNASAKPPPSANAVAGMGADIETKITRLNKGAVEGFEPTQLARATMIDGQ